MDRINHELARIRDAEIQAQAARQVHIVELYGYRGENGIMRVIRRSRR